MGNTELKITRKLYTIDLFLFSFVHYFSIYYYFILFYFFLFIRFFLFFESCFGAAFPIYTHTHTYCTYYMIYFDHFSFHFLCQFNVHYVHIYVQFQHITVIESTFFSFRMDLFERWPGRRGVSEITKNLGILSRI